jgi:hypothetical protein
MSVWVIVDDFELNIGHFTEQTEVGKYSDVLKPLNSDRPRLDMTVIGLAKEIRVVTSLQNQTPLTAQLSKVHSVDRLELLKITCEVLIGSNFGKVTFCNLIPTPINTKKQFQKLCSEMLFSLETVSNKEVQKYQYGSNGHVLTALCSAKPN